MFNVVDPETGWKADLILRKRRPFSETELSRREAADFQGISLPKGPVDHSFEKKSSKKGPATSR
jgi:hypothetical protein